MACFQVETKFHFYLVKVDHKDTSLWVLCIFRYLLDVLIGMCLSAPPVRAITVIFRNARKWCFDNLPDRKRKEKWIKKILIFI